MINFFAKKNLSEKKLFSVLMFCVIFQFLGFAQNQPVNTSKWLDFGEYKKEIAKVYRESIFSSIETLDFVDFNLDSFEI